MMYEMRRKPEPTHLPIQEIFNLPHYIDMVWEELAFDDSVSYLHSGEMDCSRTKCYIALSEIRTPGPQVTNPVL